MNGGKITITLELDAEGRELLAQLKHFDKLLEVAQLTLGGKLATRDLVEALASQRDELAARVEVLEGALRGAHARIGCADPIGTNPATCAICKLLAPALPVSSMTELKATVEVKCAHCERVTLATAGENVRCACGRTLDGRNLVPRPPEVVPEGERHTEFGVQPRSPDQIFPAQGSAESCAAKTLDDGGRARDCRMWKGHKAPHVDGEFSWPVGSWAHRCKLRDDEVIWKHNPETSCDCGEVMP